MATYDGSHNSNGGQIHWFGGFVDDIFEIRLNNLTSIGTYRHDSHHIYGNGGHDVYNFRDFADLGDRTIGRLDTFDPSRDVIQIEGQAIDLYALPTVVAGITVEVVMFHGQQWLRMQDGDEKSALFALEGARLSENAIEDTPAAFRQGAEETHFYKLSKAEIDALPVVDYENPMNFVPLEHYEDRENDLINVRADDVMVTATDDAEYIHGFKFGTGPDQSSQTIYAGGGDDVVNARSGNDIVYGGAGDDALGGGTGRDTLFGEAGDDALFGGTEEDILHGGAGNDLLNGASDNDVLDGGSGADMMIGGSGQDVFQFGADDLILWSETEGTKLERMGELDVVMDFVIGEDLIHFDASSGVTGFSDLAIWKAVINGNSHFSIHVKGTGERFLVDTEDDASWKDLVSEDNFLFGDNTALITDANMYEWNDLNGDRASKNAQLHVVEDFTLGVDTIRFLSSSGVESFDELKMWKTVLEGNTYYTVSEKGTGERFLIDVADDVSWSDIYIADHFEF